MIGDGVVKVDAARTTRKVISQICYIKILPEKTRTILKKKSAMESFSVHLEAYN